MRVVVTGGAGFVGSHLSERLIARGDAVVCVDDLSSGRISNVRHLLNLPGFEFVRQDVVDGIGVRGRVDAVAHLASPASPPDYLERPLATLAVGSRGTEHALALAHRHGARFILASTSEVYGNPEVHPQPEDYWGHVNPIGPRSVYNEAKRYAEAVSAAYQRTQGTNVGIARIFNTYGPRMRAQDGRVIASFVTQALLGEPLTVNGDGSQTRSFCFVDDLVRGLLALLDSGDPGPVNLGNPVEQTVTELAELILRLTGSRSPISYRPLPADDPVRRRPLITRAQQRLNWRPEVSIADGLLRTIEWYRCRPDEVTAARVAVAA